MNLEYVAGGGGADGEEQGPTLESGGSAPPPHTHTHTFLQMVLFFTCERPNIPNQKSQADADMQPIINLI